MPQSTLRKAVLLASTAIGFGATTSAMAQEDIIVTARRVEERLQDVPISITVLNQNQISDNNITNAKDLATFTPGLNANSRNGSDATNFSIRGFTQEQRTQATVGVFFADVVAPRGSGASFGGDGAGPGALFDLQNVQVLKGPQGTLQGRNVTGGAVLFVPRKPTGKLEGYVEGSIGDYSLRRIQGVINIPVMDTLRIRVGVDRMTRNGYLNNIGRLGDGVDGNIGMGNVNYVAARFSAVADLTPNLENYFIASYTRSRNNGVVPKLLSCNQVDPTITATGGVSLFGVLNQASCQAQLARESGQSPWTVENRLGDAESYIQQWQMINTTTWQASDSLTVKNITSYAEYRNRQNQDLFGNYYLQTGQDPALVTSGAQVTGFAFTHANANTNLTNAQSTFVEELQLQGRPGDGKLIWQAGLYAELSDPLGWSGVQTATATSCVDITTFSCGRVPGFSLPSLSYSLSKTKWRDYAVYGQATYSLTDTLKLTAGARYTWDKQISQVNLQRPSPLTGTSSCLNPTAPGASAGAFPIGERFGRCVQDLRVSSEAPTWTIGLDYKPIEDALLYAKYSRGYRAAGLSLFGPDSTPQSSTNLQPYRKEKVDSYEIGAKTSWRGPVPGLFNISGFYNSFSDQQLLLGAILNGQANALVANAGKSRLYGVEADLSLRPIEGLVLNASYSYLNTKLQQFIPVNLGPDVQLTPPLVGEPIPNTQPHKLNLSGSYTLPLPESVGKITFGATYIYTASYKSVAASCPDIQQTTPNGLLVNVGCYDSRNNQALLLNGQPNPAAGVVNVNPESGRIPASNVINLSVNWEGVGGEPVDLGFFMTNVTNEVYYVSLNDNTSRGFRSGLLGEPRMYGFRLKYRFGS
ncbi:MAG TPA: TonB-dependent receptor [Sphingobium sp.]